MQQANNMNDLEFLRENYAGNYKAQLKRNTVLLQVQQDPGYPHATHDSIADGLMRLHIRIIDPNYEFQLTNDNRRTISFLLDTVRPGFWFTDSVGQDCQSVARYDNHTLSIEMTPQVPTARKVTYQFYERNDGDKSIMMKVFNGTTWWTMPYKKTPV